MQFRPVPEGWRDHPQRGEQTLCGAVCAGKEISRGYKVTDAGELELWYQKLLDEYHKWVSYRLSWKLQRNASMENLEFPFAYRKGQREMVSSIYHAVSSRRQIFIQAPTGVGKTMSAVFPAVRAAGQGMGDTIFYLTAKTITRTVAQDAFDILRSGGLCSVGDDHRKRKTLYLRKPGMYAGQMSPRERALRQSERCCL